MQHTFTFTCRDNGGKCQCIKIKAPDKATAILKGLTQAKRKSAGDITVWECKLNPTF